MRLRPSRLQPWIALLVVTLVPLPVAAWQVAGGYVKSDAGLTRDRDGLTIGVTEIVAGRDDWLDVGVGLDYVQKGGSYTRAFAVPNLVMDHAKVCLHMLEPSVTVGVKWRRVCPEPRLYAGLAYALKLDEVWDNPDGRDDAYLTYETYDAVAQVGLSLHHEGFFLDLRYVQGLTRPLIDLGGPATPGKGKAAAEPEPVDVDGHLHSFRAMAGWRF